MEQKSQTIVELSHFIEATRDSGYKNLTSAIAELIDNSFEAHAEHVCIEIAEYSGSLQVVVADNGSGMTPSVLRMSLQFGGSTRFNSRKGIGRYGMGLPNASLSQARRVDVVSWTSKGKFLSTFLDVDDITDGITSNIPKPRKIKMEEHLCKFSESDSGTIVIWSKCDRLDYIRRKPVLQSLKSDLGQIFRHQLWNGKKIILNGDIVPSRDPLFLKDGNNLVGASQYGEPIIYPIKIPESEATSDITIRFIELPIEEWFDYSNYDKNKHRISKQAGVSVIRNGREIDYGWFFMGAKRKENYDDWWRCEIQFSADLDELFGVTHTKQEIRPNPTLMEFLTPDIERIARELHVRVRNRYFKVKESIKIPKSAVIAQEHDIKFAPPVPSNDIQKKPKRVAKRVMGLKYHLDSQAIGGENFFNLKLGNESISIELNNLHPFYQKIYQPLLNSQSKDKNLFRIQLELLLFAWARAESQSDPDSGRTFLEAFRKEWSNVLAAFLT